MRNSQRFGILVFFSFFMLTVQPVSAETLANCSDPEGQVYYVAHGLVDEKDSGWVKDKITDGSVSLIKNSDGYDILFMDATNKIVSSVADGAKVMLMSHTKDDAIFLIAYAGTIEIYKFFQDSTGAKQYAFTTTRSNTAPITKISLMIGSCSYINFESIK
jgi:hypothetical protein